MTLRTISDLDINNKTVILRLDLNLPTKSGKFTDNTRLVRSIPTIKYLLERNAKIIIISHMGRPKGEFVRDLSLAPLVDELENHLKIKVKFATDCTGPRVRDKATKLKCGEILLLENLRFNPGEENNDPNFARELAGLGDVFINDTFSCSHRSHASIDSITALLPSAAGFLLIDELKNIESILHNPARPFTAIVGGAKISTKINLLMNLIDKADNLVLGGAMASTFLYAMGKKTGTSLVEPNLAQKALEIMQHAKNNNSKLLLPSDFIVEDSNGAVHLRGIDNIAEDEAIMDLGPMSSTMISSIIHSSATLVWNGPVGAFETPPYNGASIDIARHVASASINSNTKCIVGGGDTIALLKSSGLIESVSYTSTGGGAFLDWLQGKSLPGVLALS
jgi:phosphoglycerate kinase